MAHFEPETVTDHLLYGLPMRTLKHISGSLFEDFRSSKFYTRLFCSSNQQVVILLVSDNLVFCHFILFVLLSPLLFIFLHLQFEFTATSVAVVFMEL